MEQLVNHPETVLTGNLAPEKILEDVKEIIDPITKDNSVLDEIHIDGLMPSQVWGEVKLVVDGVNENILSGKLSELKEKYGLEEDEDEDEDEDKEKEDVEEVEEEEEEGISELGSDAEFYNALEDSEGEEETKEDKEDEESGHNDNNDGDVDYKPEKDAFGLNDDVFSIDAYNAQVKTLGESGDLNKEGDDEEVDLFGDISDGSDDEMLYYKDFFKPIVDREETPKRESHKKEKKVRFDGKLDEDDYDEAFKEANADFGNEQLVDDKKSADNLSSFEKQQVKIQEEIVSLEEEAVAEKKWTMKGEVNARQRDKDTLLDEDLEFERTAKPVPVITQETTDTLDEIIRRRIKDERFDEVPKRVISEMHDFKSSKRVDVSQEKSIKSLAEIYEDEYMDNQSEAANEELKKTHDEISQLFTKVNYKLDALCSAHFVPKPAEKLLDVKVQTSTISMEDAQPLTLSTADTLAPQEIYKLRNKAGKDEVQLRSGVIMAKDELDRAEKQRLRRAKKRKIHNHMKEAAQKKKRVEVKQP
ncbi:hypothetical protein FOA43_001270 [Brettanomyces nanus]|uniref:U3 small nucleolar ribonucleoprotein protein MPP10 n=1 Tax=Eeniella nana TaxID=13502 RepID=A0A875S0V0_EENNA|nr:uncharacterized protein FOA43_001270 [Brettanomyces nanus]QPG73955.1 hypothetical protein FOA43_001270 [Brettanomyces nanus]